MRLLFVAPYLSAEEQASGQLVQMDENEQEEHGEDYWVAFPARYEVCGNCNGKGHHVNRAIDGNGLSADDFNEDPDFAEAYFSGVYDVPCDECHGNRVVLVPATEAGQTVLSRMAREESAYRAEIAAERRMGC